MKTPSYIKSLLPFWLFVLFFKFGAGLHYTLLSTLGSQVLPIWIVGLCIGGASLLQLIFDVPTGYLLDRIGYMRLLRLGTFVFVLGAAVLFFGLTPATFLATLVLSEFGWLIFGPGADAYVLSKVPAHASGTYLGFFHAVLAAGIVLASAVLAVVLESGIPIIAGTLFSILFIAFVFSWNTPDEASATRGKRNARHQHILRRHVFRNAFAAFKSLNPASTLLVLQNLSSSIFYGAIWFTVPLILVNQAQSGLLGLSLGVFDLAVVLLGSFLGKLADRYNQKRLVLAGLLLFALAGSAIGFHLDVWFIVLGFLATAGDEMSSVSLWTWLDRLDAKHTDDGLVSGTIVLFEDLGWTIGPALAGVLFASTSPTWTITLCALPIFFTWMASLFFLRHHRQQSPRRYAFSAPRRPRHKS